MSNSVQTADTTVNQGVEKNLISTHNGAVEIGAFAIAGRKTGMELYDLALKIDGAEPNKYSTYLPKLKDAINFGETGKFINPLTEVQQDRTKILGADTNFISDAKVFLESLKGLYDVLNKSQKDRGTPLKDALKREHRDAFRPMSEKERMIASSIEGMVLRVDKTKLNEILVEVNKPEPLTPITTIIKEIAISSVKIYLADKFPNWENDKINPLKEIGNKIKKIGGAIVDRIKDNIRLPIVLPDFKKILGDLKTKGKIEEEVEDPDGRKLKIGCSLVLLASTLACCAGLSIISLTSMRDYKDLVDRINATPEPNKKENTYSVTPVVPLSEQVGPINPKDMYTVEKPLTDTISAEPKKEMDALLPEQRTTDIVNEARVNGDVKGYLIKEGDTLYGILRQNGYTDKDFDNADKLKLALYLNLASNENNLKSYMDTWKTYKGQDFSANGVDAFIKVLKLNITPDEFYSMDEAKTADLAKKLHIALLANPNLILNSDSANSKLYFELLDRIILPGRYAYVADSNEIKQMTLLEELRKINIDIPGVNTPIFPVK